MDPGIDNKLSAKLAGGTSSIYYHLDHLGTPTGNSNAAGSLTTYTTPDSFGNGSFEFTGREYDDFTSLYYYRARMYDSQLGRFTAEDPIGFEGGDINLYGYTKNRPLKYRDPMGLDDADKPWYPENLTVSGNSSCTYDPDNPVPSMQVWVPLIELTSYPNSAYGLGWKTQASHFGGRPDPNGNTDYYDGGYRHCVTSCILAKRYGALGDLGRFIIHDLPNEILYPKPDSASDLDSEGLGSQYGHSGRGESCKTMCGQTFPAGW